MGALTSTGFYVHKPLDDHWNISAATPNYVIEARPIDEQTDPLYDWQKTDEYIRDNLKVINPKSFGWHYVKKIMWVKCEGPFRKLKFRDYVELYHSLKSEHPLPKGWEQHQSNT